MILSRPCRSPKRTSRAGQLGHGPEIGGEDGEHRSSRHLVAEARQQACKHDRNECVHRTVRICANETLIRQLLLFRLTINNFVEQRHAVGLGPQPPAWSNSSGKKPCEFPMQSPESETHRDLRASGALELRRSMNYSARISVSSDGGHGACRARADERAELGCSCQWVCGSPDGSSGRCSC